MRPSYRTPRRVARCYTRRVDIWSNARKRLTVQVYRRGLMPETMMRFREQADEAADQAEATGRPFIDCFEDPWMVFGMRRDEVAPGALTLIEAAVVQRPEAFPIDILVRSEVPAGFERILEWLSVYNQPLIGSPRQMNFDWSSLLSDALTGREGLPIESLVELGERTLGEDGYPDFSPRGARLAAVYGHKILEHSDERIEEGHLVYGLMPQGTLSKEAIDEERYPVLHKAVRTGRRRRTRERVGLEGFDRYSEEFEALLTGLTPSGSWDAFEYLAHVLDDPWKLLGKRREEMTPGTLMYLQNSSGSTLVRRTAALENDASEDVFAWAEWLRGIDDGRDTLWHAIRKIDRDIVSSTLRSLYPRPTEGGQSAYGLSGDAVRNGSCVMSLTADDINEMIRRGVTAPEAARLLKMLRTAEAFRLHFYEGMPAEYAAAMVDWPDV